MPWDRVKIKITAGIRRALIFLDPYLDEFSEFIIYLSKFHDNY
jgi:hypothetical protein